MFFRVRNFFKRELAPWGKGRYQDPLRPSQEMMLRALLPSVIPRGFVSNSVFSPSGVLHAPFLFFFFF